MATINPFQGPINYATDVQSPFEAALGGFKIGAAGAEIQQAQQKRAADIEALRLKNEKQLNYATGITTFFNKKPAERNYSDLEKLFAIADPEQITNLQNITKTMDANKLDASKKLTGQLLVAFEANPTEAKSILQQKFDAETDPNQKAALKTILDVANIDPEKAANLIELQGATAFGDDWYKGITAVRQERRTAELGPSVLAKSINDADKSLAEAQQKLAEAADTPARLIAEKELREAQAKKAAVEAKYAERTEVDKLIKNAADLGLTKAQTNEVLAKTSKLGFETKKAALELENLKNTGGVDPAKAFEYEEKLRKEFQTRTKVYGELGTTFSNIESSAKAKTGPGDIALITGFMKMLDPGSVVRETEFATARDTAGLYARLLNTSQKLQSGQLFTLDSKQRQEYVNLAQQYLNAAQKKAAQDKRDLSAVVTNYKLNPENVFGIETVGAGRGTVNPPVPEQRNVTVDY
jgi:hypothetical protein